MRTCMLNCCRPLIRPTWDSEAQKTYSAFHIGFFQRAVFCRCFISFWGFSIFRRACGDMFPIVAEKCWNLQFINFASAIFRKISEWVFICCQGYQSATPDSKRFPADRFGVRSEGNQQRYDSRRGFLSKIRWRLLSVHVKTIQIFGTTTILLHILYMYIYIYKYNIYIYTLKKSCFVRFENQIPNSRNFPPNPGCNSHSVISPKRPRGISVHFDDPKLPTDGKYRFGTDSEVVDGFLVSLDLTKWQPKTLSPSLPWNVLLVNTQEIQEIPEIQELRLTVDESVAPSWMFEGFNRFVSKSLKREGLATWHLTNPERQRFTDESSPKWRQTKGAKKTPSKATPMVGCRKYYSESSQSSMFKRRMVFRHSVSGPGILRWIYLMSVESCFEIFPSWTLKHFDTTKLG